MQKKKVIVLFSALLWLLVIFLTFELGANLLFEKENDLSEQYSADWDLRKVTECFHSQLWKKPWIEYKPGASVRYERGNEVFSASINNDGFRGPQYSNPQDPTIFKIVCMGGSTTANGPDDTKTYPALLQAFISSQPNPQQVEVLNCGVAGMDSGSYHRTLDRLEKQDIMPDLVVEYNGINSIAWKMIPYWKSQLNPIQTLLLKSTFVRYLFGTHFLPSESDIRKDIHDFCITDLRRLHSQLEEKGVTLCVASFVFPDPSQATTDELRYLDRNTRYWWKTQYISYKELYQIVQTYNEELKRAFSDSEVHYLPLAEYGDFSPKSFLDIAHMRPEGIEKKAFILSKLLPPIILQSQSKKDEKKR